MKRLLIFLFILVAGEVFSENITLTYMDSCGNIIRIEKAEFIYEKDFDEKPNPLLKFLKYKQERTRRLTAALLAFPFPFGIVGLHRIYLGTEPYVPVVYIASLGGVFGILPLVDFFAILFDKDFERYNNSGKVFMWIRD